MTVKRYREIFKAKAKHLTDKEIESRIVQDRNFIQSFIRFAKIPIKAEKDIADKL